MNPQLIQLIKQAVTYLQQGKVDDAERLLKQVLRLAPKHPEVMRLLAVILAHRRELAEALKMIDSSIKIDNKNFLAHSNKGNILKDPPWKSRQNPATAILKKKRIKTWLL